MRYFTDSFFLFFLILPFLYIGKDQQSFFFLRYVVTQLNNNIFYMHIMSKNH